jgi:hypothetical protein
MKRIFFAAVLSALALVSLSSAKAQNYESYGYNSPRAQFHSGPVHSYPHYGGWGGWGYHSSTYEQGVLMGLGDLYRGVGEYNVANSVAAYNWQLARNADLQNSIAERSARAAVYASVRVGQARRHEENKKENASRAKFNLNRPVERLTSKQINRETGEVAWPTLLTDSRFDAGRGAAEEALGQKYQLHQVSMTQADESLLNSVDEMQQKLENSKEDYKPSDYYAARGFLIRLKQEASQAIPAGRLAASL